jgi:transposase
MTKKRTRRVFDAAFKIEAVRRMEERKAQKVPLTQIAQDLDIRPDMLRAWARQLRQRAGQAPTDVFPGEGKLPSAEEELRQVRRELEVVRQERDFLKKAAAYFAKESR